MTIDPALGPLAGSHILLTGATGFLGQAVVEKLLATYPDTRISVLIRPRDTASGQERFDALLDKPVFATWRDRVGEAAVRQAAAERVQVIEGGLDESLEVPGDLDVVIHCASAVTFDAPIDEAFDDNVAGAQALYAAMARSGSDAHVVHVSTAYVAGLRKGLVVEAALTHDVDWETEARAAASARASVEDQSRQPETLQELIEAGRAEYGKAGPQAVAAAAETARREWVRRRLVDFGRTRAQSLGWADVYTLTKALGERVAEQVWAETGHRLSIVRPSIIESSVAHPFPGWIDGFKVADPLIMAYGKGYLREFPGLPDSVLDVIPVDLVVNATLAAAATPPPPRQPAYFHVTSGARNPLPYRRMYDNVHEYFLARPLTDSAGKPIRVPDWQFPGARQVRRRVARDERLVGLAERGMRHLPGSPRTRSWMGELQRRSSGLGSLRTFADLYQSYTQTEVIYDDSRTKELNEAVAPERAEVHGFDVSTIDWEHYLQEVHVPSVVAIADEHTRRKRARSAKRSGEESSALVPRSDVLAVFDLQGTVLGSNAVEQYLLAQLARLPRAQWPKELAALLGSLPRYVLAERRDRGEFIRAFVRRYAGTEEAELLKVVDGPFGEVLRRRMLADAVARVNEHRAAGHHTVLVTGGIDVLVRPLASFFDDVVAARMHSEGGRWTGYLDSPPLVDEARAAWLQQYAAASGFDLAGSYAYGDSHADRVWLELVGNPQAVNPDLALYRHAKQQRWQIHDWKATGRSRLRSVTGSLAARAEQ